MFSNVYHCWPIFADVHQCSPMFFTVFQCSPMLTKVPTEVPIGRFSPGVKMFFLLLLCVFLHPVSHFIVPLLWAQQVLRERGHFSIWVQENLSSEQMVPPPQIPPHIHCRLKEKYGHCWKKIFRANKENVQNSLSSAFSGKIWNFLDLCWFGFLLLLCGCISNSCYCVGTFNSFCCCMLLFGCCGFSLLLCCVVGALLNLATVGVFSMFRSPLLCCCGFIFNVWLPPAPVWVHFKFLLLCGYISIILLPHAIVWVLPPAMLCCRCITTVVLYYLLLLVYFQCLVPPCYVAVGSFSMFDCFLPCCCGFIFNVWLPPAMLLWVHFKLLPTIKLENELGKQYKSLDGSKIYLPRDKWLFTLLTINCQNLFVPQQWRWGDLMLKVMSTSSLKPYLAPVVF